MRSFALSIAIGFVGVLAGCTSDGGPAGCSPNLPIHASWSNCQNISSLGDANFQSVRTDYRFSCDGSFATYHRFFTSSDCSYAGVVPGEIIASTAGTYNYGSEVSPGVRALDLRFSNGITLANGSTASAGILVYTLVSYQSDYNSRNVCGFSIDWNSVSPNLISVLDFGGRTCEFALGYPVIGHVASTYDFDLISVDTTLNPYQMTLGDRASGDGTSEASRPTSLLSSKVFLKTN